MSITKEKAKENLRELVAKFDREAAAGRINDYNEQATKTAFIQPLLRDVLGWNVSNRDEVSPEEKVSRGRVDYGLKIEGQTKIFVEAKPPKADLKRHIEQAIGYGYNRKSVPFVLLTDFEDIKLFDVTVKPDVRNPLKGLKIALNWQHYLEEFDQLWLLSKDSIISGELDKLLLKKPKDRLPVDKAILDDLKKWREMLAKDIFRNNTEMFRSGDREKDAQYLKEITQRLLDRIIFMRSCEDRKLVYRDPLKRVFEDRTESVGKQTMVFLSNEFKHYNIIFDSDLFRPLEWEKNLIIDFKVMRDIVLETYNPYQFDVIPLDVLGNIYEQYLGYIIRLTDHQVKYELKPELRKAGGVYYTPEYIVDYIVKNTVGKLLQELPASRFLSFRPRTRFGRGISSKSKKFRILDPACGSGSFLIRAYEEMLNYYKNQKRSPKTKSTHLHTSPLVGEGKGEGEKALIQDHIMQEEDAKPILTIEEKARILQEHIFGVDIDEQAVEVTKLSLMLKMLEGEFGIIPGRNILPMLDKNIRCGNSLISGDTLELQKYFGNDWYKVKAFNWNEEFRKIIVDEGGFDCVIGNPPWVSLTGKHKSMDLSVGHLNYFFEKYECDTYMPNIYELFIRRSLTLMKKGGFFSFIVPDRLCANQQFITLRKKILADFCLYNLWFKAPFPGIIADTVVFVIKREKKTNNIVEIMDQTRTAVIKLPQVVFRDTADYAFFYVDNNIYNLFIRIKTDSSIKKLSQIILSTSGCGAKSKEITTNKINNRQIPILKGESIQRYKMRNKFWFEFIDRNLSGRTRDERKLGKKFKVLLRKTGADLIATFDDSSIFPEQSLYFLYTEDDKNKNLLLYLLAVLNSKLMNCYYRNFAVTNRDSTPQLKNIDLDRFPIKEINLLDSTAKKCYDDLVALVNIMLDLDKKIQTAKGSEKEQIQRQIEKTDKEIDDLVYKLYGITEEERKIIEGNT